MEYTDEALLDAIARVRSGVRALREVADAIDRQEPIRDRIVEQIEAIEAACAELERIEDDASQELL